MNTNIGKLYLRSAAPLLALSVATPGAGVDWLERTETAARTWPADPAVALAAGLVCAVPLRRVPEPVVDDSAAPAEGMAEAGFHALVPDLYRGNCSSAG